MDSRTRLLLSMAHTEPDRIPIFSPNIINTHEPYGAGLRRFLDGFEFDSFVSCGGVIQPPGAKREVEENIFVDGYGCRYKYMGMGLPYCTFHPLANAETVADVEAHDWPDPEAPGMIAEDVRAKARAARERGDRLTNVGAGQLFHQYDYLRGFEQWMVDIKLNRKIHDAIASRIYHINSTLLMRLLEEVGEFTDMVSVADDFGNSTIPYMSPDDFRALVKPYYKDLIAQIKGRFPHIKFYLHSHGQIMDLVPDLIDCGVDVLNPILPLDHMDAVRLKRTFGRDLCFHGGVDIEHIVPFGTVDEVRDHVREVIDTLAPGGGFWFKLQAISPVIPPRNVMAAYELALEYGQYEK